MHATSSTTTPIAGFCQCGCGAKTNLITQTDLSRGRVKGKPSRYLRGHNTRKLARYSEVETTYGTCWIWRLAKNHNGYPIEWDSTGRTVRAHRRSYEAKYGPIPLDGELDHLCRIRACVNPDHLEPVNRATNVRRGASTKLTMQAVIDIRASTDKNAALGSRFGISPSQVSRIKNRRSWREVGQPSGSPP